MGKIQDYNFGYSLLKPYVDFKVKTAFKSFLVRGQKNLPADGAVIIGINHSNALMDALIPLSATKERKVFIARGDIFKKPKVAKLLNRLRILPIYRIRDGFQSVKYSNDDTMQKATDVVHDKIKLCLYPEARHRTKHSLIPLSKGIFHIALKANEQFGNEMPIYVVPTGIEYGDYFRYRSDAMITFGEPINVTEYVKEMGEASEAIIMNGLKAKMSEGLQKLISYVPDDDDYDAIWELTKIRSGKGTTVPIYERLVNNKCNIEETLTFKNEKPEEAKSLFEKVRSFTEERKKAKISTTSMKRSTPVFNLILKTLVIVALLPLYVVTAVASLPYWLISYFILVKLKDFTWRNTVNFGVDFALWPIIMILTIVLAFVNLPWTSALALCVLVGLSYHFFMDYREYARLWWSDFRWLVCHKKLRKQYEEIKNDWINQSGMKF